MSQINSKLSSSSTKKQLPEPQILEDSLPTFLTSFQDLTLEDQKKITSATRQSNFDDFKKSKSDEMGCGIFNDNNAPILPTPCLIPAPVLPSVPTQTPIIGLDLHTHLHTHLEDSLEDSLEGSPKTEISTDESCHGRADPGFVEKVSTGGKKGLYYGEHNNCRDKKKKGENAERRDVVYKTLLRAVRAILLEEFNEFTGNAKFTSQTKGSKDFGQKVSDFLDFKKEFWPGMNSVFGSDPSDKQYFKEVLAVFLEKGYYYPNKCSEMRTATKKLKDCA